VATHSPDRREHSERRHPPEAADDLYQRIEEKRKQFERRTAVRRQADRTGDARTAEDVPPPERQEPSNPPPSGPGTPSSN
jgi:hypothetical protein